MNIADYMNKHPNRMYIETRIIILAAVFFCTAGLNGITVLLTMTGAAVPLLNILAPVLFVIEACVFRWWIVVPYRQTKHNLSLFTSGYSLNSISGITCHVSKEMETLQKEVSGLLGTEPVKAFSKRQAEFIALQNQINPHFLYNTLEGIRSEALIAGLDSVANMTEALATFFRYTISYTEPLVSLQMELDNTRNYFFIQQYRFGSRLKLNIKIEEDDTSILHCKIPKLTLQPIVENSIIHGLECKKDQGTLTIRITATEHRLLITVSDDGVGMDSHILETIRNRLIFRSLDYMKSSVQEPHSGIALENVNNRIKLLFGEDYGLSIESCEGLGTDVDISLPAVFYSAGL